MLIQGIIGIGGEKKGKIKILDETDSDLSSIDNDDILILRSTLSYNLYQKINDLNIQGKVCGGIDYQTLTKILKKPLGVAITGMEDTTTIMLPKVLAKFLWLIEPINYLKKTLLKWLQ